jgi:hypothetical protein
VLRLAVDRPTATDRIEQPEIEGPRKEEVAGGSFPTPAIPTAVARPGQAAVDRLKDMPSGWGARRFDREALPDLTYGAFGLLTERGARTIERIVETLHPAEGEIVLFRGQKKVTPTVSLMPADETEWSAAIDRSLAGAKQGMERKIEDAVRHDAIASLTGGRAHELWKEHYRSAEPLDQLITAHKESYGIPLFVSSTRNLEIAAGDYNMRTTKNENRYIYVLVAPEDACINVHASDYLRVKRFVEEGVVDPARVSTPGFFRDREAEIAVWLDATPYVAAIYDAQNEELVWTRKSA